MIIQIPYFKRFVFLAINLSNNSHLAIFVKMMSISIKKYLATLLKSRLSLSPLETRLSHRPDLLFNLSGNKVKTE